LYTCTTGNSNNYFRMDPYMDVKNKFTFTIYPGTHSTRVYGYYSIKNYTIDFHLCFMI
jgi:hypothetical protein